MPLSEKILVIIWNILLYGSQVVALKLKAVEAYYAGAT